MCPAQCQEEHAFHYVRLLSGIMHSLIIALCHWQCILSACSRDRSSCLVTLIKHSATNVNHAAL